MKGFKDSLLKGALKLFSGLFFVQVFNLLFQMLMGRLLQPEEFALLASVLGLLQIFTFPMGVFSSALSRYTSLLVGENRVGDAGLLVRWAWHLGNRHLPVQFLGAQGLRIAWGPVIADMLRGLGADPHPAQAPFAPEGGAYGGGPTYGHSHGDGEGSGGHHHDH